MSPEKCGLKERRTQMRKVSQLALLLAILIGVHAMAAAQQLSDSGSVSLQGTVSGYVEIRAGGSATLTGNSGGGITNNKSKGASLSPSVMTIDFGEVGPSNTANFVIATVPLRLRSNVSYTLKMSASAMTYGGGTPDTQSVTLADIGFGVTSATRDSGGGVATGTDNIAAAVSGDPTSATNGSVNTTTGRYTYNGSFSLNSFTTSTTILTGPRIMNAMVPSGNLNGLVVTTVFAIKPQFFTPGSFSTSVTFTISNP
jgi:hypothetical protein